MADDNILGDDMTKMVLSPVKRKKGAKSKPTNISQGVAVQGAKLG